MKAKYLRGPIWQLIGVKRVSKNRWANPFHPSKPGTPIEMVWQVQFRAVAGRGELTVLLHDDGGVRLYRLGQQMGMKKHQRHQVSRAAHQAVAFYELTESMDGFPPVSLL